jgi:hypothetical protein
MIRYRGVRSPSVPGAPVQTPRLPGLLCRRRPRTWRRLLARPVYLPLLRSQVRARRANAAVAVHRLQLRGKAAYRACWLVHLPAAAVIMR